MENFPQTQASTNSWQLNDGALWDTLQSLWAVADTSLSWLAGISPGLKDAKSRISQKRAKAEGDEDEAKDSYDLLAAACCHVEIMPSSPGMRKCKPDRYFQ